MISKPPVFSPAAVSLDDLKELTLSPRCFFPSPEHDNDCVREYQERGDNHYLDKKPVRSAIFCRHNRQPDRVYAEIHYSCRHRSCLCVDDGVWYSLPASVGCLQVDAQLGRLVVAYPCFIVMENQRDRLVERGTQRQCHQHHAIRRRGIRIGVKSYPRKIIACGIQKAGTDLDKNRAIQVT